MFEDSLVVSQVCHTSSLGRWTAVASVSLQFAFAALVIALPLLHPERLEFVAATPQHLLSLSPRTPVPVRPVQTASSASSYAPTSAIHPSRTQPMQSRLFPLPENDAPLIAPIPSGIGMADGIPINNSIPDVLHEPPVAVVSADTSKGPARISSGVSAGMLLSPIRPIYPEIARATRVEGTVVVEATISRTGTIESVHIISGPTMLQRAAVDAIRTARYRPYRLNGSPTEVQTTISVNFRLGS